MCVGFPGGVWDQRDVLGSAWLATSCNRCCNTIPIRWFPEMGVPQELDGLEWKDQKMKWMIWAGYHHFRNPHIRFLLLMCTFLSSILYTTQHFVFWVSLSLCKVYLLTITDAFQTFQPSWAWRVHRSSVEAWAHASSVCRWVRRQSLPGRVLDFVGPKASERFRNHSKPYLCMCPTLMSIWCQYDVNMMSIWCQYDVSDVSLSKTRKSMSCRLACNLTTQLEQPQRQEARNMKLVAQCRRVSPGCWSFWRCALSRRTAASRPTNRSWLPHCGERPCKPYSKRHVQQKNEAQRSVLQYLMA